MNTELFFRLAVLVVLVVGFSISAYFRRKASHEGKDRLDHTEEGVPLMIVLRIAGFGVWIAMLVYVVYPDLISFATVPLPDAVRWVGLALSLAALPLILWMFRSLGGNITDTVATRQSATLVTRGPYRWIRHPLYSFGTLFFVGMILMSANGLIAVLGITALTMLLLRTPKEEERLVARFGDAYRVYIRQTGRFVPKLMQ